MRDDLTVIYGNTAEDARAAAHWLGLTDAIHVSRRSGGLRGFQAYTGRIILVGDVELKDEHRMHLRVTFQREDIPMLRIQRINDAPN